MEDFKRLDHLTQLVPSDFYSKNVTKLKQYVSKSNVEALKNSHEVHMKGLSLLTKIISKIDSNDCQKNDVNALLWCCLSCISYFYLKRKLSRNCVNYLRERRFLVSIKNYKKFLEIFLPMLTLTIVHSMLVYITEEKMWKYEDLCITLFKLVLNQKGASNKCIYSMIMYIEHNTIKDMDIARKCVKILSGVLKSYTWQDIEIELIGRFMEILKSSVMPFPDDKFIYEPINRHIKTCVRFLIENIKSEGLLFIIKTIITWTFNDYLLDEDLLEFGNILEYAALLHQTKLFKDTLSTDLFPLILKLISSENYLQSLLGNRIFQHLLDRNKNRLIFRKPQFFYKNLNFDVHVGENNSEDKMFMKRNREIIHNAFLNCVLENGRNRLLLENAYTSMALLLVEIPCAYSACATVCLVMAIQENIFLEKDFPLVPSHHIHATLMSIMSLLCWIHKADIFYAYLNKLLETRALYAPFLNPPLLKKYFYADHYILWPKTELFFEDVEVRYGLWKCFRGHRK